MICDRNLQRRRLLPRFVRNEAGNVAMLFGLLLLPMLGSIGLAIDFGSILTARNKAQVAADAAALQAAGVARDLIKASNGDDVATAAAIVEAQRRAQLLFKAHAEQSGLKGYTATVTVTRTGQQINSSAAYSVNTTTYLAKLFGQNSFATSGSAISSGSLPTYANVYVLMDVSQSMGLAATQTDAIKLFKLTNCVFGCHVKRSGDKIPLEQVAHTNGVRLRIDVLRDAVTQMITDAQAKSYGDSIYQFGLYTMSLNAALTAHALNELSPLSGNYTSLKLAATGIELSANNDYQGRGDSHIDYQLQELKLKVANSGDGSSQAKARVFVFLVTDGLRDYRTTGVVNQHVTGPIDPANCAKFKSTTANITLGVLYTTYLPIYADPNNPKGPLQQDYINLVKTPVINVPTKLRECASPDWYFEASDDVGISAAFDKMFAQTTSAPSLTN